MRLSLFQSTLTRTLSINIWLADCHFELKLPNAFSAFHPAPNTCQLKCLYCLLVAWQNGTQELVFGMIITDPEHWRFRLKWRDYHDIIAQWTPYKSHNAKRAWFVLVFDVIMQCVYRSSFLLGQWGKQTPYCRLFCQKKFGLRFWPPFDVTSFNNYIPDFKTRLD